MVITKSGNKDNAFFNKY